MVNTVIDDQGNEIIMPDPAGTKPAKAKKGNNSRLNDQQIAKMAMDTWGKPLAYQAGQFWSYTNEAGWEVCTNAFNVLCNQLRGSSTEGSVMKICAAEVAIPDLEHSERPTTYWEYANGQWVPFPVSSSQVVFANGVLDLTSMEFTPTEHRIVFGPRVSIEFDADNGFDLHCEEFERLVEYALPEVEHQHYLQDVCSALLQPHVVFRGQIVFVGVPHSGKSTLATAIATAPGGARGQAAVSEARLIRDKWASTMLVNKFANVSNDSASTSKWEAWMKEYTTGSFVAEAKFAKPITVPTTAKLIATCNEFQPTTDLSGAATHRYRVFRFNNPIAESGRADQGQFMTAAYWSDPTRRAGIVSWLLNGLSRVIEHGIREPESLKKVKNQVIYESNETMEFVATCIERCEGAFLTSEDIAGALGGSVHGVGKAIPKYIERIWGVTKTRRDGKRGYANLKLV